MAQTVTLRHWPSSFLSTPTPRDAGKSNNTNKVENKESERYESVARHSRDEHRVAIYGGSGEIQKALLQASEKKGGVGRFFGFQRHPCPTSAAVPHQHQQHWRRQAARFALLLLSLLCLGCATATRVQVTEPSVVVLVVAVFISCEYCM